MQFIDKAGSMGAAIRIGVNAGSIERDHFGAYRPYTKRKTGLLGDAIRRAF